MAKNDNITPKTSMDISPLLKDVYPKPEKRISKSKRFGRIKRLLETETIFDPFEKKNNK